MDILGVGGWEMMAILVITLIVAGPARMIRWAYLLGQFFAKLRVMWSQAAASLQKEFDAAGMDVKVPTEVPTRQTLRRDLTNMVNPLLKDVREPLDEFTEEVRRSRAEVRGAVSSLKSLNGSGSMSDPMGTRPPKPTTEATDAPTDLGIWGAEASAINRLEDKPAAPSDLGVWGRVMPADDDESKPTTSEGES